MGMLDVSSKDANLCLSHFHQGGAYPTTVELRKHSKYLKMPRIQLDIFPVCSVSRLLVVRAKLTFGQYSF